MVKRTFGQVLVETRKRAGLTQKELAGRLRRGDGRLVAPSHLNAVKKNATPEPAMARCRAAAELQPRGRKATLERMVDPFARPGPV
jgi:transcriptional regulator with XRE-family HTH domain